MQYTVTFYDKSGAVLDERADEGPLSATMGFAKYDMRKMSASKVVIGLNNETLFTIPAEEI